MKFVYVTQLEWSQSKCLKLLSQCQIRKREKGKWGECGVMIHDNDVTLVWPKKLNVEACTRIGEWRKLEISFDIPTHQQITIKNNYFQLLCMLFYL